MEFSQHLEEEPDGSQTYPLHQSQPYTCSKGHRSSLSLPTSDGRICLVCLTALLSDPHSLSHHLSFALSNLSVALRCDRIPPSAQTSSFVAALRTHHPHLLVGPLVRALSSACDRADDALARQVAEVVVEVAAALDASVVEDFVTRISEMLCLAGSLIRQLHTLHCFGVLLASHHDSISATSVRDKFTLFPKLLDGLQLPSEEIRGEILFVLYKLSVLQATPWDDDYCNLYDDDLCGSYMSDLLTIRELTLQHSLNVLLKTQSDDVRLNCIALLLVLAKRDVFDNLLVRNHRCIGAREENKCIDTANETVICSSLMSLFADAVKGSLLSSNTEVQAGALDLISHFLSWGPGCVDQIQAFIEENIVDYLFEVLRLSGKNDILVASCIEVLSLLSAAEDAFNQKLAIGFQTILSVLHYVAEIPYHPAQPHVLKLVLSCVTYSIGVMSPRQMEEIAVTLTQMFKGHSAGNLGMNLDAFVLVCLIYVEILKSQSACDLKELPSLVKEASKHAISSILSSQDASDTTLLLHSIYFLKEALVFSHEGETQIDKNSEKISLETSIVETCATFLLPWLQGDIRDEDSLLGVLELFHTILLNGSPKSSRVLTNLLASSSWFCLSFGFLGLFPRDSLKSMVYMIHSLVVDQVLGAEFGEKIRDLCLLLPLDPLDLLYLLGQKCLLDFELASCQHCVLILLYVSSLYGERIADETQILASLEQYILINSSNFTCGRTDCLILTQLILLYSGIRGTLSMNQVPYSLEAEKTIFNLVTYKEWDLLSMPIDPVAIKWLFQQETITHPLSNQILSFCQSNASNSTCMQLDRVYSGLDLQTIAELAITGDNYLVSVFVLILGRVVEMGQEADVLSVLNVIIEIIRVSPESSNRFCLCGIANALNSLCGAFSSSVIFEALSVTVFDVLCSANYKALSDVEWLALTLKLLEKIESPHDSQLLAEQENILLGIFCLVLHHSTRQVLKDAAKAVIFSRSLVSLMDRVVQEACAKGPALSEQGEETPLGELLILVLLLSFFSLRSLHAILETNVDWQDFFQSGIDSNSTSVLGIPCHELCKILSSSSSLIKLISSQCLAELFDRISEQKKCLNEELKCSSGYLQSIIAVTEGFVFHENGIVSRNCGSILATILGWENRVLRDCSNKWCKLIVEELVVALGTASGLSSKGFACRLDGLTGIVVALLRWETVPVWIGKLFRDTVVSGIVNQLTARNVTGEIVKLFRQLMKRNYLTQEHVSILHHLFQICRGQLYDDSEADELREENEMFNTGNDDSTKRWAQLIPLMLNQTKSFEGSSVKNKKLLDEIDLFFQESGK